MDTAFAPDAESFLDFDNYMIVDRRVPFSDTATNSRTPIVYQSSSDALLGLALVPSQQTSMDLPSFDLSFDETNMTYALGSREGRGINSSYDETHMNLDGDEFSARLLSLAERTPMSREDILFGGFMEIEGSASIPQWRHSTSSESSFAYTENSLITPSNHIVSLSDTLPHSFAPIFPRYFQQQVSVYQGRPAPGPIDHPHSPLSYKAPLMEQRSAAVLSSDVFFDSEADADTDSGLGISISDGVPSQKLKTMKKARGSDDEEDSQRKKRRDNKWRMYC